MENKDGLEMGTEKKEDVSEGTLGLWPRYRRQTTALVFIHSILKKGLPVVLWVQIQAFRSPFPISGES